MRQQWIPIEPGFLVRPWIIRAARPFCAAVSRPGWYIFEPMKVGRNEPCSCGSGKKYKTCCGAAPEEESQQILAWRRLSRAVQDHAPKLLNFIAESHGRGAIQEAWEEFTLWSGEPFDPESPQVTLFYPWLFHVWKPLTTETEIEARCLHSIPPSQAYLIAKGKGIDPLLYRYLSACLDSPFGFFEIISADPGHGMQMREILTEATCAVLERSASGSLRPGDILYGMVVECDGIVMLEASAPVAIPIGMKPMIVEERELLLEEEALEQEQVLAAMDEDERAAGEAVDDPVDFETDDDEEAPDEVDAADGAQAETTLHKFALLRYDFSNRELYWKLVLPLLNPTLPELHTTDGDPLSMQRLIFAIDSAADAFAALKGLAVGHSEDALLRDAQFAPHGALRRVEFNWTKRGNSRHKGWETTVLGRIEIDDTRLAAEVNSAQRASEFKRLVSEQLGDKARYRVTEIQSIERLVAEARANPRAPTQADLDQAALMAQPEVQAHLRDILTRHYDAWVDERLPALLGKTPREAVRTAAGREKVDALICDIERMGPGMTAYDVSITDNLRKKLGL
jgi:SEC-C motif